MNQQPHVLYVQLVTEHRRITPDPADFERVLDLARDLTPRFGPDSIGPGSLYGAA